MLRVPASLRNTNLPASEMLRGLGPEDAKAKAISDVAWQLCQEDEMQDWLASSSAGVRYNFDVEAEPTRGVDIYLSSMPCATMDGLKL